ncbi:MAG: hypothetical protein K8I60_14135, partial [Anaerolineae bacterium]|nr:hypothetical protein [Anaerolineae bacterium]
MFWRINTLRRRIVPAWILILPALLACNLLSTTNTANTNTAPISGTPVVHLAAPLPNSTFMEGVSVNIQAQITNAGPDINRVEVVVDNAIVATLTSPNQAGAPAFSISQAWQSAGSGLHTVTVTAFRADGPSSAPASVNINVVS